MLEGLGAQRLIIIGSVCLEVLGSQGFLVL